MTSERLLLIVEDDEAFARTLKRSFERRGYSVLLADSLETVNAYLADHRPGFAVVDLKLAPSPASPACRRSTPMSPRCSSSC